MNDEAPYVLWFDETGADRPSLVGGKAANLARLVAAGFTVPRGFCVTARAYERFVSADGLQARNLTEIRQVARRADIPTHAGRVRRSIVAQGLPEDVSAAIRSAYAGLGDDAVVAVRSSATAEDLPEASFAGQQDTYLNVMGAEAVLEHVRQCWASLWTDRAVSYRKDSGYPHESVRIAVVVQTMLQPQVSGVLFTANPVTGSTREAVINASYGLGEAIVSGLVTPDTFTVDVEGGVITRREIGSKSVEIVGTPSGVRQVPVDGGRASRPSLDDRQVLALAGLGARVARHYGSPQDIEWALADGHYQLLQCRPITTLGRRAEPDPADHWNRAMFTEILPEAPSPSFCSVLEPILGRMLTFTFDRLGLRPPSDIPAIGVFRHQPYLNMRFIDAALSGLPEASRVRMRSRIANPFADHAADAAGRSFSPPEILLAARMLLEARRLPEEIADVVDRYYVALEPYRSADVAALDSRRLLGDIRRVSVDLLTPLVEYDFLLIAVLGFAQRLLAATVARSGVPDPEHVVGELLSGVTGNSTMEANKALWRLAEAARRQPEVAAAVCSGQDERLADRLGAVPGGTIFAQRLAEFLSRHGHRETHMDIATPTWAEDPGQVLGFVRGYLASTASADPADQESAAAARRAEAEQRVRAGLGRSAADRRLVRPFFGSALLTTHRLAAQRDTMHYHWTAAFPVIRRMMRELGARLTRAGALEAADDVFVLELGDLDQLVAQPRPSQSLVSRRRRAWEADRRGPWPVEIHHGHEVFAHGPDRDEGNGRRLRGVAGSPGLARGRVRIVRGPEDFERLRPGEVLVAPLTNPVWTPLFAIAAAVVTDAGGILSHGAIVAREYGIPAVMGIGDATQVLRDGEVVSVDGARGTVDREGPAPGDARQP